ncbi:hypothetical protein Bbelb_361390 [Branchiostoma belcheri]|nr:hypothetical protein Bbelb_361390 [Branchiostoma belcheri]
MFLNKSEFNTLQTKVNNLEQYSRRNCAIISGIPETPGERSTDNPVLSVANDTLKCDPPLNINDIDRSHRLGKPRGDGKPRPIIVKFCSYRSKAALMRAKTSGRAALKENGIFVNENLTKANMDLLKDARSLVKMKLLNQAWSYDGKIFVKTPQDHGNNRQVRKRWHSRDRGSFHAQGTMGRLPGFSCSTSLS